MDAGGHPAAIGSESLHTLQSIRGKLSELAWPPVLQRAWSDVGSLKDQPAQGSLRILSLNLLADSKQKEEEWSATPAEVLDWSKRRLRLLEILLQEEADILCLQELLGRFLGHFYICSLIGFKRILFRIFFRGF